MPITFLEDHLKGIKLTKTDRLIADFIAKDPSTACFISVTAMSQELGVSDTSIIRFCRKLGFEGYPDFQHALQHCVRESVQPQLSAYQTAMHIRVRSSQQQKESGCTSHRFFERSIQNINATFQYNSQEKFDKAAELLLSCRQKYIVGFRGSSALAQYFGSFLPHLVESVTCSINADSSTIEHMLDLGPEDCVVIISCERYSKMARIIADMARESGCKLIAVTDKISAPIAYNADVVFLAEVGGFSGFHAFGSIFVTAEALFATIIEKISLHRIDRLKRMEQYLSQVELY